MTTLVVGWNSNIDEFSWGVGIAKTNDWDVDIAGFLDGLSVGSWIGDDDESRFLEGAGDVVGEVTRGETTGNGLRTGVSRELEDGTLTIWTGRDDTDIGWVVDSCDDSCSEDNLLPGENVRIETLAVGSMRHLPGFANVDHMDSIRASLPQIWFHVDLQVLGTEMTLCRKQLLNVVRCGVEDWR